MIHTATLLPSTHFLGQQTTPSPLLSYSTHKTAYDRSRRRVVDLARETYTSRYNPDRPMKDTGICHLSDERRGSADISHTTMYELQKRTATALARMRQHQVIRESLRTANSSRTKYRTQSRTSLKREFLEGNHKTSDQSPNENLRSTNTTQKHRVENNPSLNRPDDRRSLKKSPGVCVKDDNAPRQHYATDKMTGEQVVNSGESNNPANISSREGNAPFLPDVFRSAMPKRETNARRVSTIEKTDIGNAKHKRVQFCLGDEKSHSSENTGTISDKKTGINDDNIQHIDVEILDRIIESAKHKPTVPEENPTPCAKKPTIENAMTKFKEIIKNIDDKVKPRRETTFHFSTNATAPSRGRRDTRPSSTANNSPTGRMLRRAGVDLGKKKDNHSGNMEVNSEVQKLCSYRMPLQIGEKTLKVNKAISGAGMERENTKGGGQIQVCALTEKNIEELALSWTNTEAKVCDTNSGQMVDPRVQQWVNDVDTDHLNRKGDDLRDSLAGLPIVHCETVQHRDGKPA